MDRCAIAAAQRKIKHNRLRPGPDNMTTLEELLQQSVPELRKLFLERGRPVPHGLVEALEASSVRERNS